MLLSQTKTTTTLTRSTLVHARAHIVYKYKVLVSITVYNIAAYKLY